MLFISCNNNVLYAPDKLVEIERPKPTDTLRAEQIYLGLESDTSNYCFTRGISCVGSYIVQITNFKKHFIRMCDLRSPEKIVFFGSQGRAGNEFVIDPQMLNTEETADGELFLYCIDSGKNGVMCIDAKASYQEEKCIVKNTFQYSLKTGFNTFFPFYISDSDRMIAAFQVLSYPDARDDIYYPQKFYFYGQSGETEKCIYPKGVNNSNHAMVQLAYFSAKSISPDRTKVVESLYNIDVTNVYDLAKGEVLGIIGKEEPSFEFFELTDNGDFYEDNMRVCAGDVTLSNDKIFRTTWGGVTNSEYKSNFDNLWPWLEVYDYEGKLLGSFVLEQKYHSIVYSDFYDCIFSRGPGNTIYKYELPQWLKKKQ